MHAGARHDAAEIIVAHRGLPCRAPCRRPWREGRRLDRTAVGLDLSYVATTNKAMWAMVEIIAIELIDAHSDRAGSNERVEVELLVVEEPVRSRNSLMCKVAADHALVGDGIVRLSDFREQQELHIED